MTIAERINDSDDTIVTIELHGRLTGETLEPFRLAVARRLSQGGGLIIDLRGVDYIDSEGLGSLIQAYTSCRGRGTPIVFVHVSGRNLQLLKTTKLLTVFDVYNTAHEAQRSLAGAPSVTA